MLKPTRTILALAAGSLVLGLVGAGAAVADEEPMAGAASQQMVAQARYAYGKVVSKGKLKVRSKPSTHSRAVGYVYPDRKVEIKCKKYGESVDGNAIWYRLADENGSEENGSEENGNNENGTWPGSGNPNAGTGGSGGSDDKAYDGKRWVSARYVKNLTTVRYCH
ncbi:SH3 domain-containing protein [Streptomyces sp. NBC_00162]|uniref:SH3 domain-containing protein n=1 Tax=Streptomyces sp. NBC_00162 TaxID=2903629 RepID=UPI00214CD432|nr:SH3 domain-containing protein [Streptomyces sp. NBC_00162]UUU38553.1 SH3 domain-containing protein [Streptomyces sp. NBC_00162]